MSQFGNQPVHPARSKKSNASPFGAGSVIQHQQFTSPPPIYGAPMLGLGLDESENPFSFCCSLIMAARAMVVVNLGYYGFSLIGYGILFVNSRKLPEVFGKELEDQTHFYECSRLWGEGEAERGGFGTLIYWTFFLTFVLMTIVLDLVIPMLFVITVFGCGCDMTLDQQIRYSSWYSEYQFCCPYAIVWTLYNLAAITKRYPCNKISQLWLCFLIGLITPCILNTYCGLVGKAYRNALQLQRRNLNLVMNGAAEPTSPTTQNLVRSRSGTRVDIDVP